MTPGTRLILSPTVNPERQHKVEEARQQGRSLWELSKSFNLDLALIPSHFQPPRLVVFDMDSTLIQAEVIDELAIEAGVGERVKLITEKAMQGELNFDESLRARVALLQGLPETALQKVFNRISLNPGVAECLERLRSHGIKTAIASGGFRYFAQLFAARLQMDFYFANELEIQTGVLTGKISGEILNAQTKAEILSTLARQLNLSLSQVVAVGDGANDLPMLRAAGLGVAFHAKEKVQREAAALINYGSMETLLDFIGISREA